MPYLSEDKECIGFLLKSEPGMSFISIVSARTLLPRTHKQKVKQRQCKNAMMHYLLLLDLAPVEGFLFQLALW